MIQEMSSLPTRRPELLRADLRGRHVVYDPGDRQLYELRPDAAALWETLDGTASFEGLADELAAAGGLTGPQAQALLREILTPLVDRGLVELSKPPADHEHGPAR